MDWLERLAGSREIMGLLVAVIGLVTAVISRKKIIVHITEDAQNSIPTTRSYAKASPVETEKKENDLGLGTITGTILFGAALTGLGVYLIQPTSHGPDHWLPLGLLGFGGLIIGIGIGWMIPSLWFGIESLNDEMPGIPKGSASEALHKMKSTTAYIICICSVAISWIVVASVYNSNASFTNVMGILIALFLIALAGDILVVLPSWWIRYKWRRWKGL